MKLFLLILVCISIWFTAFVWAIANRQPAHALIAAVNVVALVPLAFRRERDMES